MNKAIDRLTYLIELGIDPADMLYSIVCDYMTGKEAEKCAEWLYNEYIDEEEAMEMDDDEVDDEQ